MSAPRVLLYSHDGFGLGHLQRNFNIACALTQAVPGTAALLVGGSPHGFDSRLPPGVDWIKLPSVVKHGAAGFRARTLRLEQERVARLRAAALAAACEQLEPHLIVVDHLPAGVWGELPPLLELCRRRARPPAVVLGLRDILDRPQATRARWLQSGAYPAIETLYDRVLVYGDPRIFATADAYGLAHCLPHKLVYCGYVTPPGRGLAAGRAAARRTRAELALRPHEKLVVATGGGGGDAYPLLAACAGAVQRLAAAVPLRCILVTGPLMPEQRRQRLRRQVAGLPVEVWWQVEDLAGLLGAADLVVAMAGYNTLVEALQARRPLVVVPRPGPSAEQSLRAEALARLGLLDLVPSGALSPARLAAAIERGLAAPPPERSSAVPRLDGMGRVVQELSALLAERVPDGIERLPGTPARGGGADLGAPRGRPHEAAQGENPRLA